jgi:DNA-binding NarL/FixJ family response regulator
MIRIIMADDHEIVRKGLIQIVSGAHGMAVSGEAGSADELLEELRRGAYDVVVLDIKMPDQTGRRPGKSGLEALMEIRRDFPGLPVLVLSTYSEDEYAVRVLEMGASGYMTKQAAPQELIGAIKRVHAGKRYVSATLAERLALMVGKQVDKLPHETLSAREFQVMRMIAEGRSLKEAAHDLGLSEKTVSTYRTRILEKMDMKKNIELARYALQHGLIE